VPPLFPPQHIENETYIYLYAINTGRGGKAGVGENPPHSGTTTFESNFVLDELVDA
jgi:hypothetical protein